MSGNGGGSVDLGVSLAALLGVDARETLEWRETVSHFSLAMMNLIPSMFAGFYADPTNRSQLDVSTFVPLFSQDLWSGRLGKEEKRAQYTRSFTVLAPHADETLEGIAAGEYSPPALSDIVILTDGRCGSTCALFTASLRDAGVRSLGFGGYGRLAGEYGQPTTSSSSSSHSHSSSSSSSSSHSHSAVSSVSSYSPKHSLLDTHSFAGGFIFTSADIAGMLSLSLSMVSAAGEGERVSHKYANANLTFDEILEAGQLLPLSLSPTLPTTASFAVTKGVVFERDEEGERRRHLQPLEFAGSPVSLSLSYWGWTPSSSYQGAPFTGSHQVLYTAASKVIG